MLIKVDVHRDGCRTYKIVQGSDKVGYFREEKTKSNLITHAMSNPSKKQRLRSSRFD